MPRKMLISKLTESEYSLLIKIKSLYEKHNELRKPELFLPGILKIL